MCASDPVTEFGVKTLLGADPRVKVLAEDEFALAEVIVVAEAGTARGVLPLLREVRAAARSKPLPRCVVVTDSFRADAVVAAIDCGMAALLPSSRITGDALVRTILAVLNGDGVFPSWLQAQLLDQLETIRRDVLEPRGSPSPACRYGSGTCCGCCRKGTARRRSRRGSTTRKAR